MTPVKASSEIAVNRPSSSSLGTAGPGVGRRDRSEAAMDRRATPVGYVGYAFSAVSRPPTCQHLRHPLNLLRVVRHGILKAVSHLYVRITISWKHVDADVKAEESREAGTFLLPN